MTSDGFGGGGWWWPEMKAGDANFEGGVKGDEDQKAWKRRRKKVPPASHRRWG